MRLLLLLSVLHIFESYVIMLFIIVCIQCIITVSAYGQPTVMSKLAFPSLCCQNVIVYYTVCNLLMLCTCSNEYDDDDTAVEMWILTSYAETQLDRPTTENQHMDFGKILVWSYQTKRHLRAE